MDYQKEYFNLHPDYHRLDAPRKLDDLLSVYNSKPKRIIDLGCGVGTLSHMLFNHFNPDYMVGLDLSKKAVAEARKSSKKIHWISGDVLNYKTEKTFDVAFVADLMEHLDDDLSFLKHVSKISNRIILRVPLENTYVSYFLKICGVSDEFARAKKRFGHVHYYSIGNLRELFCNAGLKIEKMSYQPLAKRSMFRFEVLRWFGLFLWIFSKPLSARFAGSFAVFSLKPIKNVYKNDRT